MSLKKQIKKLGKEQQNAPPQKKSRRKKITARPNVNVKENQEIIKKVHKAKSQFFDKINKVEKLWTGFCQIRKKVEIRME